MTGRLTTLDRDRVEHFMREYDQPCHDGDYPRGQVRLQERYGSQALRRGVATALRKRVPGELRDPGGWASYVSPLKCYTRQDSEAQRAALGRRLETGARARYRARPKSSHARFRINWLRELAPRPQRVERRSAAATISRSGARLYSYGPG